MGTFDDVVEEYPWDIPISQKYFEQTLVRHALFGGRLILNDGYLLQNSLARKALLEGPASPFYDLIYYGQVRVLSGEEDFTRSLVKRAEDGVTTIKSVVESNDWPIMKARLDELSKQQNARDHRMGWPSKNMGIGFRESILRCRGRPPELVGLKVTEADTLERIFDGFLSSLNSEGSAARTVWEKEAKKVLSEFSPSGASTRLKEVMGLANEAYHMNFAICLTADGHESVGVETRQSASFNELVDEGEILMESIPKFKSIELPNDNVFRNPNLLRLFSLPGEPGYHAKVDYLEQMQNILGPKGESYADAYEMARQAYTKEISRVFGNSFRFKRRHRIGSLSLTAVTEAASAAAGVPFLFGAVAFVSDQYIAPFVIKRLSAKNLELLLDNPQWVQNNTNLRVEERRRRHTQTALRSITIDAVKSKSIADNIPDFSA